MKKYALVFLLLLGACTQFSNNPSKENQYLFVISSNSGSFDNETLTLEPVPLVIYFSDRPDRIAGHINLREFVTKWDKGVDSYQDDPPNATLSIADNNMMQESVIELMDPKIENGKLIFKVKVLENEIPKNFGPNSLFIDLYGIDTAATAVGLVR